MKRLLSVLLICALAFSACAPAPQTSAPPSSVPSSSEPQGSNGSLSNAPEPLYEDENGNLIAKSRAAVCELYVRNKISETAYSFFDRFLSGFDYDTRVILSDFTLTYNEAEYKETSKMPVDFTVESSKLETLPVGKYEKDYFDNIRYETLLDRGQPLDYYEKSEFADKDAVKRLEQWFVSTYNYITPTFGQPKNDYSTVINFICIYYGSGVLKFEDFSKHAEKDFGIKPSELGEFEMYCFKDENNVLMVQAGGIGDGAFSYKITDYKEEAAQNLVTIQFYGDYAKILPSHLIQYKFGKNGEFMGCETLENSQYEPAGLGFSLTRDYTEKFGTIEKLEEAQPQLAALARFEIDKLSGYSGINYTPEMLAAADKVKVGEISEIYYNEGDEYLVALIEILESTSPIYVPMKRYYRLGFGMVPFINTGTDNIMQSAPEIRALENYINTLSYDTKGVENSEFFTEYLINMLYRRCPSKSGFTKQDIANMAKTYFDIDNYEPNGVFVEENGVYSVAGHGGGGPFYSFERIGGTREMPEITLQYYADSLKMVRSHKIKYTMQLIADSYKVLSADYLETSGFEPGGFSV